MIFTASATEYSDEEYFKFLETAENCNSTYGPGIATTICVYRRDGKMMMDLLKSMPADLAITEDR